MLTLITGASTGIGRELARLCAADGHDLVLVARSEDKLESLASELACNAHIVSADLARPGVAQKLWESLPHREIDLLANNAGFGWLGSFAQQDQANIADMLQLNITTLTELTRLALPGMLGRKQGRILNVASTAGFQGGPFMALYYATKAFVLTLSEALAEEVRGTGVSVTVLCPGPTSTGFQGRAGTEGSKLPRGMSVEQVAEIGYRATLKGKRVVVPGMTNKLLVQASRILPRVLIGKAVRRLQEKRA